MLLVMVRDPRGRSQDTYLFTTDLMATVEQVIRADADRWAIEETHRSGKQFLGAEDPQCWRMLAADRDRSGRVRCRSSPPTPVWY